jgi:hypothetical protein
VICLTEVDRLRFRRGFKAEPKSLASVRVVPMCDRVGEVSGRWLAGGTRPEDLVDVQHLRHGAFLGQRRVERRAAAKRHALWPC